MDVCLAGALDPKELELAPARAAAVHAAAGGPRTVAVREAVDRLREHAPEGRPHRGFRVTRGTAAERADDVRAEWERVGCPLTVTQASGLEGAALLYGVLVDTERHADRLYRALPWSRSRPGRNSLAVVEATVGKSPAAKVRELRPSS